ncbi:MAG: hypothetical protein ACRCX8_20385 [Sarcina sp.]
MIDWKELIRWASVSYKYYNIEIECEYDQEEINTDKINHHKKMLDFAFYLMEVSCD